MGKTAFALNVATNIAKTTDKAVALFNLEMNAEQLVNRMFASVAQIEGSKLRTGRLDNNSIVHFPGDSSMIGNIYNVRLDECKGFYYMGELADA